MAYGLEVYNEKGTLNFTTEKGITRREGSFRVFSRTGSVTVPLPTSKFKVWASNTTFGSGTRLDGMSVNVQGNVISWRLNAYSESSGPTIQWGYYT